VLEDLQTAPSELFPMEWLRREQIRGFSGTAISFKGEVLGVVSYLRQSGRLEIAGAAQSRCPPDYCSNVFLQYPHPLLLLV